MEYVPNGLPNYLSRERSDSLHSTPGYTKRWVNVTTQ